MSDDAWKDVDDKPLPEDPKIEAAFPTRSGRHDLYQEAMRLVGARFSKRGLVALVNWLLLEIGSAQTRARTMATVADRHREHERRLDTVLRRVLPLARRGWRSTQNLAVAYDAHASEEAADAASEELDELEALLTTATASQHQTGDKPR